MLKRKRMEMFTSNDWTFVCAEFDQGFFFYMMRIRSALGSDLGRVCSLGPHEKAPEPRMRAKLRHYAGGVKPEEALALASRCSHGGALVMGAKPRSKFWRLLRPAGGRRSASQSPSTAGESLTAALSSSGGQYILEVSVDSFRRAPSRPTASRGP